MNNRQKSDNERSVNLGYASLQLARSLAAAQESEAPEDRERALEKAAKWEQVFTNIVEGTVNYGSRKPLDYVPVWATPEVVTGGFATGKLLANGPLQEHERALSDGTRKPINMHFLTEEGLSELGQYLETGQYKIDVPEEGALLTVAWLLRNDHGDIAKQLLNEIGGFFSDLRFYPIPTEVEASSGAGVFLWNVEKVRKSLLARKPNTQILAQKEAVEVWAPLADELVSIFLASQRGESLFESADADWRTSAEALLSKIEDATREHRRCGKPHRKKENFPQLVKLLAKHLESGLTVKDVKRAKQILDRYIIKHGKPGSDKHKLLRSAQQTQASAPTLLDLSNLVAERLCSLPAETGIESIDSIVKPVERTESTKAVPTRSNIPEVIVKKVRRCQRDTLSNLIEAGIVRSADTLAEVVPQLSSGLQSIGIRDPELRQLYCSLYQSFRRRRSLLLFNLESQVQLHELPWITAIEQFRDDDINSREVAQQALVDITSLLFTAFPHAIVPNKMLQELRSLSKRARLNLDLVNELAADIFEGEFSPKFVRAAKTSANLLNGTLYATYYDLDCRKIARIPDKTYQSGFFRRNQFDAFMEMVSSRAGVKPGGWSIAVNGMLIEQQQILTTQNLAVLTEELSLQSSLSKQSDRLAKQCFRWIIRRLQANSHTVHDHLIAIKNSAYAWRQMIFFLSMCSKTEPLEFLGWAKQELVKQPMTFQERFAPALAGLHGALVEGRTPSHSESETGTMFLGWTNKRHWLMPEL